MPPTELGRCTWRARCRCDREDPEEPRSLRFHVERAVKGQVILRQVQLLQDPGRGFVPPLAREAPAATCEDERTCGEASKHETVDAGRGDSPGCIG